MPRVTIHFIRMDVDHGEAVISILKDIYDISSDILKKNPGLAQKMGAWVSDLRAAAGTTTTGANTTLGARKQQLIPIINSLENSSILASYGSQEKYFQALIAIIAETTHASGIGCIIEDFYQRGRFFYFPVPLQTPEMKDGMLGGDFAYLIGIGENFYKFYSFVPEPDKTGASYFADLEAIVRQGSPGEKSFENKITSAETTWTYLGVLRKDGQVRFFVPGTDRFVGAVGRDAPLIPLIPANTRKLIAEGLNRTIQFELV